MEFNGTFELEETSIDDVWLALSDPVLVEASLPGCQFLLEVEDTDPDFDELEDRAAERDVEPTADEETIAGRAFEEGNHYAALLQISVGPVNPTFRAVGAVDHREFPEMSASGEGSSSNSSFEGAAGMSLSETEDGVEVEWNAEAEVFGKIAQMGQRVIDPVANRVVKRFFSSMQDRLHELGTDLDDLEEEGDDGRDIVDRVLGRSSDSE